MILDFLRRRAATPPMNDNERDVGPGEICPTPGSRRIVLVTGAGMSADAGLSTYRGPGGRYEDDHFGNPRRPELHADDLTERPEVVFGFVREIQQQANATKPHRGHDAVATCRKRLRDRGGDLTLITLNIDDLHERAGTEALHLHGRAWKERCTDCDYTADTDHEREPCPACGAAVRPDVVLFGERTDPEASYQGKRALRNADAVYVVGSSGIASSIDRWLLAARRDYGIPTVLITKDPKPPFVELFDVVIDDRGERVGCYLPSPV